MNDSVWAPYIPSETQPWDLRRVVHLHRRAGFAATWDELQRDLEEGPQAAMQRVLTGTVRLAGVPEDFESIARLLGDAAVAANNPDRLKAWWVYRTLFSPDPLSERLTLMWHNHFATSNLKVADVRLMRQQNELFRRYGRGPFGSLLRQVVKHPAMLNWLDAQTNRKGSPNENLARELMELFTLGVGHYSERDVKEAARALTGWTTTRGEFRNVQSHHDCREKTILGHTGTYDGDDLLDILLQQPAVARRIAWRLCNTFMGEGVVEDSGLSELANGLQKHDLDIGWAVKTIFTSRLFFAEQNIRGRILGPVEYVIGAVRMLEAFAPPPSTLLLAEQIAQLGQDLFYPPSVFGWAGGRSWMNTRSVIRRLNFPAALLEGVLHSPAEPVDVAGLAQRHGYGASPEKILELVCQLATGHPRAEGFALPTVTGTGRDCDDTVLRQMIAMLLASPAAQRG